MYIEKKRESANVRLYIPDVHTERACTIAGWWIVWIQFQHCQRTRNETHTHTHRRGGKRDDGYPILCWISRRRFPFQSRRQWGGEFRFICWRIDSSSSSSQKKNKNKIVLTFLRRSQIQLIVKRKGGTSCSIDAFDICDVIKTPLSDGTCR